MTKPDDKDLDHDSFAGTGNVDDQPNSQRFPASSISINMMALLYFKKAHHSV